MACHAILRDGADVSPQDKALFFSLILRSGESRVSKDGGRLPASGHV